MLLVILLGATSSPNDTVTWLVLLGLGLSPVMVGATDVIVGNAPVELAGVASGLQSTALQVSGTIGTAVLGADLLCTLAPRPPAGQTSAMTSSTDSNPEDEYADDEYADHDAEDRAQPSPPTGIPDDEPEADVLEQRQDLAGDRDGESPSMSAEIPDDEPEADVLEQRQELEDDDYEP
ncbi:MAG TPA: hypothetical protein VGJ50_24165 [Streptosporangiaceae bacterium]